MIKPTEITFLPEKPGCYLFYDKNKEVLYVGKAKNIKKRVSNYFQKKELDPKTSLLVTKIKLIDFILTKNEVEAFLLENNLIKKHRPHFNLDLKDSRRYAYLYFSKEKIPILKIARVREKKGEYFGPFVSGGVRKTIMDSVSRHFKVFTYSPSPKIRKTIDLVDYANRVKQVKRVLRGQIDELIIELEKKMRSASNKNNFEYALTMRNQISALVTLKEKQVVELTKKVDAHLINYKVIGSEVFLLLFSVRKGVVEDKEEFVFDFSENFFEEFLVRLYETKNLPSELILPKKVSFSLKSFLRKKSNKKINFVVPKSGEKKELLNLVLKNIDATFFAGSERIIELKNSLGLKKLPRVIECFDVSHLGGTNVVGAMSYFRDGLMDKKKYRRFRVKTNSGFNDLVALEEIIKRRYSGSLSKKMSLPDLVVVDGGITQLKTALKVINELGISVEVVSLAEKFEEIYLPNSSKPIKLTKKNKGLLLLRNARDEAHRFSNAYRRVLQKKDFFKE